MIHPSITVCLLYVPINPCRGGRLCPPGGTHRRVCTSPRLPLVTKGSCRRRRLKGSERCRFAERYPVARQNVHLLIPSVTASPCHRLAAARSRRGSDSPPGCHSMPRRRFATLVTKGRLFLPFPAPPPASSRSPAPILPNRRIQISCAQRRSPPRPCSAPPQARSAPSRRGGSSYTD